MDPNQVLPSKDVGLFRRGRKIYYILGILSLCLALILIFNVPSFVYSHLKTLLYPIVVNTSGDSVFKRLLNTPEKEVSNTVGSSWESGSNPTTGLLCQESNIKGEDASWLTTLTYIFSLPTLPLDYGPRNISTDISNNPYYDEASKLDSIDLENNKIGVTVIKSKISGVEKSSRTLNFDCKYDESLFLAYADRADYIKNCNDWVLENGKSSFLECVDSATRISYKLCQDENGNKVISDCVFLLLYSEDTEE